MDSFLFLDANVFLSFFEFGKDDLAEMDKVVKLITDGNIVLYTNSHLRSEIRRNRESRIASGFNKIDLMKYGGLFPSYYNTYAEMAGIKGHLKEISKLHSEMLIKIRSDIENKTLRADSLIDDLFSRTNHYDINPSIIDKARSRSELGDPPGKKGSIGDAIHWECLLHQCTHRHLDIVSHDGDFASDLRPDVINPVLAEEWRASGRFASISLYGSLTTYFNKKFPQVELSKELEKYEISKNSTRII